MPRNPHIRQRFRQFTRRPFPRTREVTIQVDEVYEVLMKLRAQIAER